MRRVTVDGAEIEHRRWGAGIVLCALALSTTFPAVAQETGSRLRGSSGSMVSSVGAPDDSEIGPRPTDEAIRVLRGLTKCLVQTKRNDVTKFMLSPTEETQKAALAKLTSSLSLCLSEAGPVAAEMSMGGAAFRGALAEALLARQDLQSFVPIEPSKTEVPYWLSDKTDQRVVEEMAICVSDRDPHNSAKLVQSNPGSPTEADAFTALTPLLGPCLIRGTALHANRVGIRLAIADAVYHRTADSGPAVTASAGSRQ